MPRYRVTCEDGSVVWVDADNEAGLRRHMGHPATAYLKGAKVPVTIEVETDVYAPRPVDGAPRSPVVVGEAVGPVVPNPVTGT